MIKDNERFFYRIHVVIDAFVIALSYLFACFLQLGFFIQKDIGRLTTEEYLLPLFFVVPGLLLLYYAFNLYTSKRVQGRRLEIGNIVKANSLMLLIFLSVLMLRHMDDFSRQLVFLFYGIDTVLEVVVRFLIRRALVNIRKKGMNLKRILLVGYSRAAEEYIDRINANPQWGYVVRGILDDNIERGTMYKGVKVIGRIDNLLVILPQNHLDEIAITLGLNEYYKLERIVGLCEKSGVHTKFIPDYNNIIPTKPYTEDLLGLPVINIRHVPLSNTFNMMVKRTMDVCGSLLCIVLFSPVMLLMAALIKLTSPGPLIFKQERVGLHNRPFKMYKFRSMEVQTEREEQKVAHCRILKGLAEFFPYTYVLDFHEYAPVYDEAFKKRFYLGGQMNAVGYLLTGQMAASYIDYIIREHMEDFSQVGFIGKPFHNCGAKW